MGQIRNNNRKYKISIVKLQNTAYQIVRNTTKEVVGGNL